MICVNIKRIFTVLTALLLSAAVLAGCDQNGSDSVDTDSTTASSEISVSDSDVLTEDTAAADVSAGDMFTKRDLRSGYESDGAVTIACEGDTFKIDGDGATADGAVLTVSKEGVYIFSGNVDDGRIVVDAADSDKIQLVLNGLNISCSNHAPVFIKSANKVFITTADNTENTVADGGSYTDLADDESNVDAAIFSRADLTLNGGGVLNVNGSMSHAIVCKDDLVISGGTINAESVSSAVCGKDSVRIGGGMINITSGADGIKSDNTEEGDKGFVYIGGGDISITAETDGIQAETSLTVENAAINLTTGGGSENASANANGDFRNDWGMWGGGFDNFDNTADDSDETSSAKGLKAGGDITVSDSVITADTSDDSIHSNSNVTVESGTINITSGDDGIHADTAAVIDGGDITISKSYEGLEGSNVTINGGSVDITASDDGINAAGGSDMSSMGGRPGQNTFTENSDVFLKITGGTVSVDADGDGLDSNSAITVEGGLIYVDGPVNDGNGALDYEVSAQISGGTVIAVGSSGMAQNFSDGSEQCSVLYCFSQSHSSGDVITLVDSSGKEIASYSPKKSYSSVVISTPDIESGGTYTVSAGGESEEITITSTCYSNSYGGFGGEPGRQPRAF